MGIASSAPNKAITVTIGALGDAEPIIEKIETNLYRTATEADMQFDAIVASVRVLPAGVILLNETSVGSPMDKYRAKYLAFSNGKMVTIERFE